MEILIAMAAGMALGRFAVPERLRGANEALQTACTCLLVCGMGSALALTPGFFSSLAASGLKGLAYCLSAVACSVAAVSALLASGGDAVLYALMCSVGVSVGMRRGLVASLRELLSFALIPIIARRLNYYACIGVAAATSEDTALPAMIRATDERTVVFSVVNGIVCSALVPVLIAALLS